MKKILLTIFGIVILAVAIIAIAGMYKFNYLASQEGYDVDGNKIETVEGVTKTGKDYEIIEVLGQSCEFDTDCKTPSVYAIQSICPYDSVCIEGSCTVVCPYPFTGIKSELIEVDFEDLEE